MIWRKVNKLPPGCIRAYGVEGEFSGLIKSWVVEDGIPDGMSGIVHCCEKTSEGEGGKVGLWDDSNDEKPTVYYYNTNLETAKEIYRLFKGSRVTFERGKFLPF